MEEIIYTYIDSDLLERKIINGIPVIGEFKKKENQKEITINTYY